MQDAASQDRCERGHVATFALCDACEQAKEVAALQECMRRWQLDTERQRDEWRDKYDELLRNSDVVNKAHVAEVERALGLEDRVARLIQALKRLLGDHTTADVERAAAVLAEER